jgi:hypothetical protein
MGTLAAGGETVFMVEYHYLEVPVDQDTRLGPARGSWRRQIPWGTRDLVGVTQPGPSSDRRYQRAVKHPGGWLYETATAPGSGVPGAAKSNPRKDRIMLNSKVPGPPRTIIVAAFLVAAFAIAVFAFVGEPSYSGAGILIAAVVVSLQGPSDPGEPLP